MTKAEAVKTLTTTVCACGRVKEERQSFCRGCYSLLTPNMRRRLYDKIGAGYEEAYEGALRYLVAYYPKRMGKAENG